jgi:hypothetical protein
MGLSSGVTCSVGARLWGAAAVYALALAVALAQLVASWAWVSGAHVTVEQVVLHEEAVAHGHADHHSGHADGHDDHHGGHHASSEALGPVFGPASDHSGPYPDVLHGALVGRPDLLSRGGGYRLAPHDGLPLVQNFPAIPHRPPISY